MLESTPEDASPKIDTAAVEASGPEELKAGSEEIPGRKQALSTSSAEAVVADERIPVHLDGPDYDDVGEEKTFNEEVTPESLQANVSLDEAAINMTNFQVSNINIIDGTCMSRNPLK